MRFNCGPDRYTRQILKAKKMMDWHKYFCWFPVRLGEGDCRWLETVERKYDYWCPIYENGTGKEYRKCT